MSILETEAVVLSDMPHGETSKIIRVYTKDYGRVSLIAKGSRKLKNRFGGSLDPLNHVTIVYYYKDNRDLHLITQCDIIESYPGVKEDLEKLSIGLSIAEILVTLVLEEESNRTLFGLVVKTLTALETVEKNYDNFYLYFLTRFLQISGFGLHAQRCQNCGTEMNAQSAFFSISRGGLLCKSCSQAESNQTRILAETVQVLKHVLLKEPEQFLNLRISEKSKRELTTIFDNFYRYHFDGYTTPRAIRLLM